MIYALASGYLMVWIAFSLGATALQRLLARLLLVSPMMEATSSAAGAVLLFLAGVYQLTPIKARLPADMPITTWVSHEPLAHGKLRRVPYGPGAWRLLRGLLLGADVAAVCGRRDERDCYRRA